MPDVEEAGSGEQRTGRGRRLRVMVGSLPIEDGQLRPPAVGHVSRLTLQFVEAERNPGDPAVSTLQARADPLGDGAPRDPGRQWDGTPNDGPVTWPTVLRGDGWSATWSAPRPVIGQVRLTGRLVDDLDIDGRTGTRGLVTRVQVVTETVDTSNPDQARWEPLPDRRRLRDVEVAPRWFDHGMVVPPGATPGTWVSPVPADPWVQEVGVLVDLDLDDVPPPPPRPRMVPGALAAHGADLWVLDERLPLLMRVRRPLGDRPEVREFPWPGRILGEQEAGQRALHADAAGCWITGPDGVHRAQDDLGVVELDSTAPSATVDDGVFTAILTEESDPDLVGAERRRRLRRWTYPDPSDPTGVTTPNARQFADVDLGEGSVEGLVTLRDGGFLALRRHLPHGVALIPHQQPTWLTHIDAAGTVAHGPIQQIAGSLYSPLLAGDPPIVDDSRASGNGALRRVKPDLTIDDGVASRRTLLGGYATARRLWVLAHPPHPADIARRSADACWPLTAPPTYPDDRQYWLLTELDPATLEPLISHLVPHRPEHLAVDDHGTVWLLADGLRHLPRRDGSAAEPFDLESPPARAAEGG